MTLTVCSNVLRNDAVKRRILISSRDGQISGTQV